MGLEIVHIPSTYIPLVRISHKSPPSGIERAWLGSHFPAPAALLGRWGTKFHGHLATFTTTSKRHTGIELVPETLRNAEGIIH